MSTHDPKDGLTDHESMNLRIMDHMGGAWKDTTAWIRRLARENAALKAERDKADASTKEPDIDDSYFDMQD